MATQDVKIRITALDKTSGALRKIGSGLRKLTKPLLSMKTALAGVIGAGGLGLLVRQSLKATDQLAKTASKIGTTTEALSALQFAGKLTGVEVNTMNMALQRFTRRTAEAANGTGEAKGAIKELGIDARELNRLPLDERMLVLADAFQNVKSESDRLRIAFKLFDSEGAALVNTLSEGRDGLADMFGEAKALGVIMSSEAARGVEAANDEFFKLSAIFKGILDQTTAALAPALQYIVTALTETLKSFGEAQGGFAEVGKKVAMALIQGVQTGANGIFRLLNLIIAGMNKVGQFSANFSIKLHTDIAKQIKDEKEELNDILAIMQQQALNPEIELTRRQERVLRKARKDGLHDLEAVRQRQLEIEQEFAERIVLLKAAIAKKEGMDAIPPLEELVGFTEEDIDRLFGKLTSSIGQFNLELGQAPKAPELTIVNSYIEQLKLLDQKLPESEDLVVKFANNAMNAFTTGFTNAITQAEKFSDAISQMAKSVIDDLIKMAVQYYITQRLFGAIVQAFTPSATASPTPANPFNDPFGDRQLARGGVATAGRPYLVGEKGAELFVPSRTGQVVPNGKFGGGVTVVQNINVTTGVQQTVRAEIATLLPQISNAAKAAVADSRMRGGGFSKAMGVA